MRTALAALAAIIALTACSATPATTASSTAPTATYSVGASASSATASPTVDNTAVGKAMADSATTVRAILEGVWRDTPQEKRDGTCQRWANTPKDVYDVFSEMDPALVKAYFDEVCSAL